MLVVMFTDVQQHHAEVHIIGDPDLDKELTLTVATSQFTRNFHLRRVKTSVLHDDFTSFTVVAADIPVRFEAAQVNTNKSHTQVRVQACEALEHLKV